MLVLPVPGGLHAGLSRSWATSMSEPVDAGARTELTSKNRVRASGENAAGFQARGHDADLATTLPPNWPHPVRGSGVRLSPRPRWPSPTLTAWKRTPSPGASCASLPRSTLRTVAILG